MQQNSPRKVTPRLPQCYKTPPRPLIYRWYFCSCRHLFFKRPCWQYTKSSSNLSSKRPCWQYTSLQQRASKKVYWQYPRKHCCASRISLSCLFQKDSRTSTKTACLILKWSDSNFFVYFTSYTTLITSGGIHHHASVCYSRWRIARQQSTSLKEM